VFTGTMLITSQFQLNLSFLALFVQCGVSKKSGKYRQKQDYGYDLRCFSLTSSLLALGTETSNSSNKIANHIFLMATQKVCFYSTNMGFANFWRHVGIFTKRISVKPINVKLESVN
jgi:hypothetical protein